jgi:hypothetical protein
MKQKVNVQTQGRDSRAIYGIGSVQMLPEAKQTGLWFGEKAIECVRDPGCGL